MVSIIMTLLYFYISDDRLEISLSDGDMDDDGFYYAELNGKRGLVPGNYVITVLDYTKVANKYL